MTYFRCAMKIISLEIKKITLGRFFPQEDKIEFNIYFNDGDDREILKVLDASEPEKAAQEIVADLKKIEKTIHGEGEKLEFRKEMKNMINIVLKGEDDTLDAIAQFIKQAKFQVDKLKNKHDAAGYLDMVRDLKDLKLEF